MPRSSRIVQSLSPESVWGWNEVLLNKINHNLEISAWLKTYDPKREAEWKSRYPKLFDPNDREYIEEAKIKDNAMDIDELRAILSRPRVV